MTLLMLALQGACPGLSDWRHWSNATAELFLGCPFEKEFGATEISVTNTFYGQLEHNRFAELSPDGKSITSITGRGYDRNIRKKFYSPTAVVVVLASSSVSPQDSYPIRWKCLTCMCPWYILLRLLQDSLRLPDASPRVHLHGNREGYNEEQPLGHLEQVCFI
ncbi:hypothetical protein MJT46_000373 [Ovis ammon polii x Ovis aries]|nr:hypothetical protein MJT46_000373 [Ovis ammon polii x Ovis aries]